MQMGLVGLGKMGGNMRERLRRAGHQVVGFDRNPEVSDVESLEAMVERLPSPKVVWVMVPSCQVTQAVVDDLLQGSLCTFHEPAVAGGDALDGLLLQAP